MYSIFRIIGILAILAISIFFIRKALISRGYLTRKSDDELDDYKTDFYSNPSVNTDDIERNDIFYTLSVIEAELCFNLLKKSVIPVRMIDKAYYNVFGRKKKYSWRQFSQLGNPYEVFLSENIDEIWHALVDMPKLRSQCTHILIGPYRKVSNGFIIPIVELILEK